MPKDTATHDRAGDQTTNLPTGGRSLKTTRKMTGVGGVNGTLHHWKTHSTQQKKLHKSENCFNCLTKTLKINDFLF